MSMRNENGFSLIEMLVSLTLLMLALSGLAGLLIQNARINKAEQMTVETQASARNCLSMIVQRLRSAGWDPMTIPIAQPVITDQDLGDLISEIEVFADLNEDGDFADLDERVLIRHSGDRIEWRRTGDPKDPFVVLATNISNDSDGNGVAEPMFVPDATPNPTRITVQITAESPAPDPTSGQFIRYTVRSDVVLRKAL
jgi:prepilin-type N-terminal cleavage/methylation domain-containing protein